MLSLPAHDLWAEYSFPLHACFYHVLERPQSWYFQWNTCILIIRVNKCFIWNYLLVNTLMIHKMCDEKQQCVGRWQNMAHVQSPICPMPNLEKEAENKCRIFFCSCHCSDSLSSQSRGSLGSRDFAQQTWWWMCRYSVETENGSERIRLSELSFSYFQVSVW